MDGPAQFHRGVFLGEGQPFFFRQIFVFALLYLLSDRLGPKFVNLILPIFLNIVLLFVCDLVERIIGDGLGKMLFEIFIVDDFGDSLRVFIVGPGTSSVHKLWVLFDPVWNIAVFHDHTLSAVCSLVGRLQFHISPLAHKFQII